MGKKKLIDNCFVIVFLYDVEIIYVLDTVMQWVNVHFDECPVQSTIKETYQMQHVMQKATTKGIKVNRVFKKP